MADGGAANGLGFDDPSLGFMTQHGSASVDHISDPSSLTDNDVSGSFLGTTTASWGFDDLQQNDDSYDISVNDNTISSAQAEYVSPSWQAPTISNQRPSSTSASDNFGLSNVDPASIFTSGPESTERGPAVLGPNPSLHPIATLTPALREKLRNIAMPPHLQYGSPKSASSPESAKTGAGSSPDASAASHKDSRKRKVSAEFDDDDVVEENGKPIKKTAHNMIEKRYRTNINDKIAALRDSVPSLRIMSKSARGEDTTEDREELHGLTPAHKLNKATVLSKATEYIRHLEKRNTRLLEENGAMQARIAAFEKLFLAGAMNGSMPPMQQPTPMQVAQDSRPQQQQQMSNLAPSPLTATQDANGMPAGMINVPDDMKRIISAQMAVGQPYPVPQSSYRFPTTSATVLRAQELQRQPQQNPQGVWSNASPYLGKLMVGSLAGLMILEAARDNESSNEEPQGRGLFAVPLQLIGLLPKSMNVHIMGHHVHLSVKFILLLGVVLWVFIPSLFSKGDSEFKKQQASALHPAPSPASPIHVRRRAWETAIQTVWVPRHNFFLEAAALMLKTLKLSLRNAFGPRAYQVLTGVTPMEETARIKSWSIALDSQLAGGDTEVSMSRLILTLLASGTLPDTPIRLMLKALHVRVLLWDLSQCYLQLGLINAVAVKIARTQWNAARQLNRLIVQTSCGTSNQHEEELPLHLAMLVEQDCDEVLSPAVIQRAHNLAFNMETTHNITSPIDGMDLVVDDTSIGSPMDAVAAWWSTEIIHEILNETLDEGEGFTHQGAKKVELALQVAPIASHAQSRATMIRAVLLDKRRDDNVNAARETIQEDGGESPPDSISIVTPRASSFDLELSLECAIALSELDHSDSNTTSNKETTRGRIETICMLSAAGPMSLLSFVSVMKVMERILEDKPTSDNSFTPLVEKLAANLRIWMGSPSGSKCGVRPDVQHKVIDKCLEITKSIIGMDEDTGYGTMSDDDDEK